MPFKWENDIETASVHSGAVSDYAGKPPRKCLTIWPNRSLPRKGSVWFIGLTFAMLLIPLLGVLGTIALWGLLPFMLGTGALLFYFLERSYKDGRLHEVLCLWPDRVSLLRVDPRRSTKTWDANPHWVELKMRAEGGPVENYITMRGNSRVVEIGAFLSPDERKDLYDELLTELGRP